MKLKQMALALSMCCSALVTGCSKDIVAVPVKPDVARLQCAALDKRPTIPPEYVIDWSKVATVAQAHAEHDTYVRSIRTREGVITGYIVELEGRLFACSNDAAWLRQFYAALPG